jgi:dephospho-CoA kinase
MGYQVLDTDKIARELMETDQELRAEIRECFGLLAYQSDGRLNRQLIASTVFTHPSSLERLNKIVHPKVIEYVRDYAARHKEQTTIVESAILFESAMDSLCDAVVTVSAPEPLRIKRVKRRDLCSDEAVRQRMSRQLTDEQREQKSDLIITNGENAKISDLCLQVNNFLCNFAG